MSATGPYASEGGDGERRAAGVSREALVEAMLRACTEVGYGRVELDDLLARGGGERADFYRHFANLADCFAAAYEAETDRLCKEILDRAAGAADWRGGLHEGIAVFVEFVSTRSPRARVLLLDVHLAGELAEQQRSAVFERLARAVDTAREESNSNHSPPPLTSLFMVSAIESAAVSALVREQPRSFAEAAPELEQLIVSAYFGD
ncbi:MAG: TetR/AcrR family transcriptional regulator [Solirubrobacterales bacterium]